MDQQENTLIPQSSSPLNAPKGIFVTFLLCSQTATQGMLTSPCFYTAPQITQYSPCSELGRDTIICPKALHSQKKSQAGGTTYRPGAHPMVLAWPQMCLLLVLQHLGYLTAPRHKSLKF